MHRPSVSLAVRLACAALVLGPSPWALRTPTASAEGAEPTDAPGLNAPVECLAVDGDRLYIGGRFGRAGAVEARHVAVLEGGAFAPLGSGLSGPALTMVVGPDRSLVVGGAFDEAGGQRSPLVARWRGGSWEPLRGPAGGLGGGEVVALAFAGPTLYAAGSFRRIGGREGLGLARWNGTDWEPVGDPAERALWGDKRCLVGLGPDQVVLGGQFGRLPYRSIARWNGSTFEPLGVAFFDGGPDVLKVLGTTLWAGGRFDRVGRDESSEGESAGGLASWDGARWRALGKGTRPARLGNPGEARPSGSIHDLLPAEGLVAGWFHTSNDIPAVAVLESGVWRTLGTGLGFGVADSAPREELTVARAVARVGKDLYVAGQFRSAGGLFVGHLARWDGSRWHGVGGEARLRWPALVGETAEWRPLFTEQGVALEVRTSRDRTSLSLDWRLTNQTPGDLLVTSRWLVETSTRYDDGLRHVHEHRSGVVRAGAASEGGLRVDAAAAQLLWAQPTFFHVAPSARASAGSAR